MTNTQPLASASIVTPHKMQTDRRVQARLLNRALGLAPTKHGRSFGETHQEKQQELKTQENQQQQPPSRTTSKERVFRCLSNTTGTHHTSKGNGMQPSSPLSPGSRSPASAQRSALKSMFQPPASSPSRPLKKSPRQQQQERTPQVAVQSQYFGSCLDRSSLTSRPLRSASAENNNDEAAPNKKVHFQPTVSVLRIPSHRVYPSNIKKTLWGSMKEIKANAIRNTAEFIFDKCNWRKCTEESRFYRDTRNGTLIHPVHVHRYYAAMQKMKQEQQAKKERQEKEEKEETKEEGENQKEQQQQLQQQERPKQEEERRPRQEEERPRKRARCCSPSPIRRSSHSLSSSNNTGIEALPDRHEAKRPRRHANIQVPIPQCRHPVYYSPQPPPQQRPMYDSYDYNPPHNHYESGRPMQSYNEQQQENDYYGYYNNEYERPSYPPHQPMVMMMHPYPPFPHHPFPPTEIA